MNFLNTNTQSLTLVTHSNETSESVDNMIYDFIDLTNDVEKLTMFFRTLIEKYSGSIYTICELCLLYIPKVHLHTKNIIGKCRKLTKRNGVCNEYYYTRLNILFVYIASLRKYVHNIIAFHTALLKVFRPNICAFSKWNIESNVDNLNNCLYSMSEIEERLTNFILDSVH